MNNFLRNFFEKCYIQNFFVLLTLPPLYISLPNRIATISSAIWSLLDISNFCSEKYERILGRVVAKRGFDNVDFVPNGSGSDSVELDSRNS